MHSKVFLYVTVVCAIFCVSWAKLHIRIQPTAVLELRQHAELCEKETGIPAANLKKIIDFPLPTDRPTKEFFFCVGYNAGYVADNGHFHLDKISSFEAVNGTKEEYVNIINECNSVELEDPIETNYSMGDCLHRNCVFTVAK
ncbi:uncharacterized protein [Epargyreus clarus]|uniref:uncharacterized protein n=1 Tax=Epargyreus clarus TaxID=520877 RepID=UPI003C30CEC9